MHTYDYKDAYNNKVVVYDSPFEMAEAAGKQINAQREFIHRSFNQAAVDYLDAAQINQLARVGDDSRVQQAEKLLERFAGIPETTRFRNVPSVVGHSPIVPAALAGHPYAMMRRIRQTSDASPLSVALSMSVSAAIPPSQIEAHGCAVLALVMKLIAVRPVNLLLFGENKHTAPNTNIYTVCRINTTPLDLASACYAMTSASFRRGLRLFLSYTHGMVKSGPWAHDHGFNAAYGNAVKARLGIDSNSLVVTGIYGDQQDFNETDWARWVEERYQEYAKEI